MTDADFSARLLPAVDDWGESPGGAIGPFPECFPARELAPLVRAPASRGASPADRTSGIGSGGAGTARRGARRRHRTFAATRNRVLRQRGRIAFPSSVLPAVEAGGAIVGRDLGLFPLAAAATA
jgi:hypothetical protein